MHLRLSVGNKNTEYLEAALPIILAQLSHAAADGRAVPERDECGKGTSRTDTQFRNGQTFPSKRTTRVWRACKACKRGCRSD